MPEFYFPLPELTRKSKVVYDCNKCGIKSRNLGIQEIEPIVGEDYKGIVILAQVISEDDNVLGKLLINDHAKLVRSAGIKSGVNLTKHAAVLPALACYTDRKPTETQFKCCRSKLKERLEELKPKMIICLGDMAFKYLFNLQNKNSMSKIRNRLIPNYEFNCLVFSTYNPSNIRNDTRKRELMDDVLSYVFEQAFKWDLERAFSLWKNKYKNRTEVKALMEKRKILNNISITEITNRTQAEALFKKIKRKKAIAFDYETTNLSPYDDLFSVVYFAFGDGNNAWVFHEDYWLNDMRNLMHMKRNLIEILTSESILKVIQNAKFEDLCSRWFLNIDRIVNVFCTMIATHVVDERRGCTSQDFQNLVRFGIPPYSDTIKKYLVTDDKKDEKINRIREAPKADMIQYNGLDVITCFNNYLILDGVLLESYPMARENYHLLLRGHEKFANFTKRGIHIGMDEFTALEEFIDLKMENTMREIEGIPEVVAFNKHLAKTVVDVTDKDESLKAISTTVKKRNTKRRRLTL
jgi:uracil-DNA glycosylase family 4